MHRGYCQVCDTQSCTMSTPNHLQHCLRDVSCNKYCNHHIQTEYEINCSRNQSNPNNISNVASPKRGMKYLLHVFPKQLLLKTRHHIPLESGNILVSLAKLARQCRILCSVQKHEALENRAIYYIITSTMVKANHALRRTTNCKTKPDN